MLQSAFGMRIDPFILRLALYFPIVSEIDELPSVPRLLDDSTRDAGSEDAQRREFAATVRTDTDMVAAICSHGYIPMGLDVSHPDVVLVKCHVRRCVHELADLHVGKSTRRRARGLTLTTDRDFEGCLSAVIGHHQERWLTQPLCEALTELHSVPRAGVAGHSVEVYRGGVLVAGEIGYTVGDVYTSLSGFYHESGAGSVQLACLARVLRERGFAFWDLGMEVEYKLTMGAVLLGRSEFLSKYLDRRDAPTPSLEIATDCWSLLSR